MPKLKEKEWHPHTRQELFLRNSAYEVLFGGAKGPGKTESLLVEATRQVDKANYKGIIFRRTFPKLQELIDRSFKYFSGQAKFSGDLKRWTWPSGATVSFGHCKDEKDKYNYQGHEYQYMGFDQLEEFTETQYLFLIAQNRSSDPTLRCYIRATANPGNVGHAWVKSRFIDKLDINGQKKYFKRVNDEDMEADFADPLAQSRAYVFSTLDDNPSLMDNDPTYVKRLEMLPEKDKKALRWGDWDAFEGQFFNEWSRRIHVIDSFDFQIKHKSFLALDYGFKRPSSVGWYAVLTDGDITRYRELYVEGRTYEMLANEIININGGLEQDYLVADPAIWGDKAHHTGDYKEREFVGESGAETMQKVFGSRFPIIKGDNARVIGWGRVRQMMKPYANEHGDITSRFSVVSNCRDFIRTVSGLVHDSVHPEDLDTDGEDHALDECRYALMSRPLSPDLPKPIPTKADEFWTRVRKDTARFNATEDDMQEITEEDTEAI